MRNLFASLILSFSVPAFADLGQLSGLYRVDRVCSDGTKPTDGLLEGTMFVSFGENKATNIYASFLVPEANTYCAERSSGEYETKEDGLRVRVAKREYLGECGGAQDSEEKSNQDDAGEFIPLEATDKGFKGTSGTDFEEGGSCKRGTHMNFEFVRVQSEQAPSPTKAEEPKQEERMPEQPQQPQPEQPAPQPEQPQPEQPAPPQPQPEQPAPAPEQPQQPQPEQPQPAPQPAGA